MLNQFSNRYKIIFKMSFGKNNMFRICSIVYLPHMNDLFCVTGIFQAIEVDELLKKTSYNIKSFLPCLLIRGREPTVHLLTSLLN